MPPPAGTLRQRPVPVLRPFVSSFDWHTEQLGRACQIRPLAARSDCFLQFYLDAPYTVRTVRTGGEHQAPRLVLVGPSTFRREDLLFSGTLRVFTVRFTAIGFRSLFRMPAHEITDHAEAADLVLGGELRELADQLAAAGGGTACMRLAEAFLLMRLPAITEPRAPLVLAAARHLERAQEPAAIGALAQSAGLSMRQMERLFQEHTGLSPKVYARVSRLKRALKLAGQAEPQSWSAISAAAGFFDQSHMVRDFRALTGETPVRYRELMAALAEKPCD